MGIFGTILNVANIGLGIANSIVNPPKGAEVQFGHLSNGREYHCEMHSGKRWTIVAQVVVHHKDPRMIGKTYVPGRVGALKVPADPNENPVGDGAVVFQAAQDDANNTKVFAINTTTDTPYVASFATTDSTGEVQTPTVYIPPAVNKYKPEWVDVSEDYAAHVNGNIGVAPADIPTEPATLAALANLGINTALPTSTLLGNFGIASVVASAQYKLVNISGQKVTWVWVIGDSNAIVGATVTNTGAAAVNIKVQLNWTNPVNSFNFEFVANGSGTAGGITTYNFPETTNGPIANASISVSQATTPAEQQAIFSKMLDAQRAAGKMHRVKYMYM